jgi:hypothetical protein
MDSGEENIADEAERWQVRSQALGVIVRGSLIGAALTAGVMLVP